MARPLRKTHAGLYHLTSHASDTRSLFRTADDCDEFLDRLALTCLELGLAILAYTLMTNHYHAILQTPDNRISEALQRLHTGYSRHHNRVHGRSAHLFRAHCFTGAVTTTEQLLNTYRYLALNPVEAGLVLHPLDWPWSSARAHAGLEAAPVPLDESHLRAAFDNDPGWRRRYRALIEPENDPAARAYSRPRSRPRSTASARLEAASLR